MDNFDKYKKDSLSKKDKSKKSSIDKAIRNLINKINNSKNYYTTSSCSGRIVLLLKKSDKKQDSIWLFKKHDTCNLKEIKKVPNGNIWFRYEAAIFHIACRTIAHAQELINIARSVGFKRSGIQATRKKIVVEIASSDYIDTIIAKNKKILVDNDYLKVIVNEANKKLKQNKKKLRKFYKAINF